MICGSEIRSAKRNSQFDAIIQRVYPDPAAFQDAVRFVGTDAYPMSSIRGKSGLWFADGTIRRFLRPKKSSGTRCGGIAIKTGFYRIKAGEEPLTALIAARPAIARVEARCGRQSSDPTGESRKEMLSSE